MEIKDVIIRYQPLTQTAGCVERWREPTHTSHNSLGKQIGNFLFASDVKASQQFASRLECPKNLRVGLIFIWKHMEAIHAENEIKRTIFKGQCAYVPLHGFDIGNSCLAEAMFGLLQHIRAIVQTSNVCLCHPFVLLARKHCCTYRHIKHSAIEIVRNPTQYPTGNLIVIYTPQSNLKYNLLPSRRTIPYPFSAH